MSPMRLLVLGLVAIGLVCAIALGSGAINLTRPDEGRVGPAGGKEGDDSWSYYHDRKYDTQEAGAKWTTDRTRSTDPDEAVLGDTTRWEYDGAYRYGPYGSDGMRRRAAGTDDADPLTSQALADPDVFSTLSADDLDPSGGAPVGVPPSSLTTPYFDPYAGYANPYANRIRLAYGEGYGPRSASAAGY